MVQPNHIAWRRGAAECGRHYVEFIGTTVPFNPFGDFRRIIPNNYRLADFVIVHPREEDIGGLAVFDLNIYSTKLLDLPAGGVGLAFGAQFQDETLSQDVDKRLETGDINLFQLVSFSGNRNSYAGYVETSIPVFGNNFSIPGFHGLEKLLPKKIGRAHV